MIKILSDTCSFFKTSAASSNPSHYKIFRRGVDSGAIEIVAPRKQQTDEIVNELWKKNQPAYLPNILKTEISQYQTEIAQSKALYRVLLAGEEVENTLDSSPYIERLGERFQILSSRIDEADQQEIISIDFDVMEGDTVLMEDIWMRISWLSYHQNDASLRFRFSFGMENFDDVSEDPERQLAAAELSQKIFPESAIITENHSLINYLKKAIGVDSFNFVERIIYFNAKNGGAQFHHDAEKGHLGVVYAQITGETFWLSLSREMLMDEIEKFIAVENNVNQISALINNDNLFTHFLASIKNRATLSTILNDPTNEEISLLLNESVLFFNQLVEADYGYYLTAGDIILLPQASMDDCAWHSVFCINNNENVDAAGEALSFAIKAQ